MIRRNKGCVEIAANPGIRSADDLNSLDTLSGTWRHMVTRRVEKGIMVVVEMALASWFLTR